MLFQLRAALCALIVVLTSSSLFAQPTNSVEQRAALRAELAFGETHERFQKETNSADPAWQFGRACFDWADFATNNPQRAEIAQQGIAACQRAVAKNSKLAAAHYYLGMNLGQLARTKRLSALHLLDEMESAFTAAIGLDETYDYAGPHRSLGLLYQDAPGWPVSLGSRSKARAHLERAVELSPNYPDNRLALLEAYLNWGEKKKARAELSAVESVLEAARKKLVGDQWAMSWQDWDARWKKIKAKTSVNVAESPKHRD